MTTTRLAGVYALGNFDGLHQGHRRVLAAAQALAQTLDTWPGLLTFAPHPRQVFQPDAPPFLIDTPLVRDRLLAKMGIAHVRTLDFTPELAALSPAAFVHDVLHATIAPKGLVVGAEFCFGKDRAGTAQDLQTLCAPLGITVETVPLETAPGEEEKLSSSQVRAAIRQGDMDRAQEILGRPWCITADVQHGDQQGREMGVPTANLALGDVLRPARGVYVVRCRLEGRDAPLEGVANFGTRPTRDGLKEWLEVHLFDFKGDLYGQTLWVEMLHHLRPEKTFASLDDLIAQIHKDCETAKAWLQQNAARPRKTLGQKHGV